MSSNATFSDIAQSWAKPFIEGLAQRSIIRGFPDGTFRPDESMTRAQFSAVLAGAFEKPKTRNAIAFSDVPSDHWAIAAIRRVYEIEFLSGYPGNRFAPDQKIPRVQILVALVNGLGIGGSAATLNRYYRDAAQVPSYASDRLGIATSNQLVVNYPDVQTFLPNQPATRAEVAAFVYQALVYLKRAPKIESPYIVKDPLPNGTIPLAPTVNIGHRRELRGVWVASVWNINWPSRRDLSTDRQKAELIAILDRMVELNLNALFFQVRPEGDTLYNSNLEPWSAWLTGTQGKAPSPFYDPLELVVTESHKRNIELHAWFNPYRAQTSATASVPVPPHMEAVNPEYVYTYGNQLWMDPGIKEVQDRAYDVVMDVLRRYDVDGIHLDDYFYPYPISGRAFPDYDTYGEYQDGGGTLSLADWRRENVNQMVRRLYNGIQSIKPYVKFGISPFGIYRPGQPPGIFGLDQYNQLFADPLKWMREGWVDYIAPQLYWRIDQREQSYSTLLEWWTRNSSQNRHVYAGNNLAKLGEAGWTVAEFEDQIEISRDLASGQSLGNIFYQVTPLMENRSRINDRLKSTIYPDPVLPPTMPWIDAVPPSPPTGLSISNKQLSWNATSGDIRAWTLYQKVSSNWKLIRILNRDTTRIPLESGTYALCAVDRLSNESQGVVISV